MIKGHKKKEVSLDALEITMPPQHGKYWVLTEPRNVFIEMARVFSESGFSLINPVYTQSRGVFTGRWEVEGTPEMIYSIEGTTPTLALVMSTNQRTSFQVYSGKTITICSNGMVSSTSQTVYKHKHTQSRSLDKIPFLWMQQQRSTQGFALALQDSALDLLNSLYLLALCLEQGVLLSRNHKAIATRVLRNHDSMNYYDLYNAITTPFSSFAPKNQLPKLIELSRIFEQHAEV